MDLSPQIAAAVESLRARLLTARRVFVHPDGRLEAADMDPVCVEQRETQPAPAEVHEAAAHDGGHDASTTDTTATRRSAELPPQSEPTPPTAATSDVEDGHDGPIDPDSPLTDHEDTIYAHLESQGENWTVNRILARLISQPKESSGYRRVMRRLRDRGLTESGPFGVRLRHHDPDP